MTGTSLKFLMMILMVLDHIAYFVPVEWQAFFHLISRPVAAVFTFLTVEGFQHTRSKEKYISRLFTAGIIMFIGNTLVNIFIIKNEFFYIENSIFLSLALGVTSLYVIEEFIYKNRISLGIFSIIFLLVLGLFTEGGTTVIILTIIIYVNRDNPLKRNLICLGITLLFLPMLIGNYNSSKEFLIALGQQSDIFFFIAGIPFFHIYNGKRGINNKFTKNFFYIFYPLHIWIIGIIASRLY